MERYSGTVRDQVEAPIQGALVYVLNTDGTLATLYDSAEDVIGNPITTDAYGLYEFYLPLPQFIDLRFYYGNRLMWGENHVVVGAAENSFDVTLQMETLRDEAAASAVAADVSETNAAASAGAAATSASASATSATAADASASGASGSASAAATSAAAASNSAVVAGAYPNTAASNVPRGLTQASVGTITAGSGGTNGTFALAWSGGNFSVNPTGTFTVSGGALTAVTITGPGLYIGSSPTVPTPSFAASSGLTGAAVALTAQFLVTSGNGYWVQSSDGTRLDRYINSSGTATLDTGTGPIITSAGLTTITNGVVGGRENVFPDQFFRNYGRWEYSNSGDKPYDLSGPWTVAVPRSTSPYPDGQQISCAGNTGSSSLNIYLPNVGLANGDAFQVAVAAARSSGSTANGTVFAVYYFLRRDGTVAGSGNLFTSVTGNLLDTTSRSFTASVSVPSNDSFTFVISIANFASTTVYIDACWLHKTSVPSAPSDNVAIPHGLERLAYLESIANDQANIALKRVSYSTRTVALAGASGSIAFSNNTGWAQSLLTSGAPAGGFNAVELPIGWTANTNAPSRIYAEVRTIDASAAKHPVRGRLVARGWIGVDPTSNGGDTFVILLRDPVTGAVKTVLPADLDDRYTVAVIGLQTNGVNAGNMYQSLSAAPNIDSTYPNAYNALPYGGGSSTGGAAFGVTHLMLTSPVENYKTASSEFAGSISQAGEGTPLLIAAPNKFYGVVGREARAYWAQIQRRDPADVNFSVTGAPAGTSIYREGIKWVPTGAATTAVTISSALGNNVSDTKTISFRSVAASAAAGTKACVFHGDSLAGNGSIQAALAVIDATDAVTNLAFLGTQGTTYKSEGYSGTSLVSFYGATLNGGISNPFYGGGTFSPSTWIANSTIGGQLSALSKAEPDYWFIEAGKVDVGAAASDGAALAVALSTMATAEAMVQAILAATTNTKVVVWTAEPGPNPTGENIAYGPLWRVRRNWMILAQQQIAQFGAHASSRVFNVATGCAIDPLTGWPRTFGPANAAITRDLYTSATYAGMSLAQADKTVGFATDVGQYFIKVGGSGVGFWREAREDDGFAWRSTDSIHYSTGAIQVAEAVWALIKNLG